MISVDGLEKMPAPAGANPFRIKGVSYLGHIDYVDIHIPGGMPATLAVLTDPGLRTFFQQPFLAASRYDVYPLVVMGRICARMLGLTFSEFIRMRAKYQAERDISGVYRMMLRLASPMAVAKKLPQLTAQYFDFGRGEVEELSATSVKTMRSEIPLDLFPWYTPIAETYVMIALEMNGAKKPRARVYPPKPTGVVNGVELGTQRADFEWE